MFRFHFLHKQQQGSSSQLGREAFDLLSVCSSLQAWMFSAAPPPSSFTRGRGPISVTITTTTTLSPFLSHPPTHRPLASFPISLLALGWSAAWGVQRGNRGEGGSEQTGRREETWKEVAGEQEEGRKQGRGGQEREKRQRVKQWSGSSRFRQGKGGRSAKTRREQEWEGMKEGVLINMASGRSVIPLALSPTLYHFLHQLPTHKTLIFPTNSAEMMIQNREMKLQKHIRAQHSCFSVFFTHA